MSHNNISHAMMIRSICTQLLYSWKQFPWILSYIYVNCVVPCYREEYHSMKKQWKSFSEIQLNRFRVLRDNRDLISKQLVII